jgi:hypothetical protein
MARREKIDGRSSTHPLREVKTLLLLIARGQLRRCSAEHSKPERRRFFAVNRHPGWRRNEGRTTLRVALEEFPLDRWVTVDVGARVAANETGTGVPQRAGVGVGEGGLRREKAGGRGASSERTRPGLRAERGSVGRLQYGR